MYCVQALLFHVLLENCGSIYFYSSSEDEERTDALAVEQLNWLRYVLGEMTSIN